MLDGLHKPYEPTGGYHGEDPVHILWEISLRIEEASELDQDDRDAGSGREENNTISVIVIIGTSTFMQPRYDFCKHPRKFSIVSQSLYQRLCDVLSTSKKLVDGGTSVFNEMSRGSDA